MTNQPLIIPPQALAAPGAAVRGAALVIQNFRAEGLAHEVAPLHVHHADDEAWHVVSGALQPSRYIFILPPRLEELIGRLHETSQAGHPAVYRSYQSELLE